MTGYTQCACRDCFEVAMTGADDEAALCGACEEAGCSPDEGECEAPHAYCDGGEVDGACATCGAPSERKNDRERRIQRRWPLPEP